MNLHRRRKQRSNGSRLGWISKAALSVLVACSLTANAVAANDQEHMLKAAFIANFIKFIDWPDLGKPGSKFIVGVYGAEAFERCIEDTLGPKSISGHPISVEQIHSDADIRRCKVVVSGASGEERVGKLSKLCADSGVVLIGEADNFAKMGGTIGFLLVQSKVRFEINLDTARRTKVSISSKLLSLAQTVYK